MKHLIVFTLILFSTSLLLTMDALSQSKKGEKNKKTIQKTSPVPALLLIDSSWLSPRLDSIFSRFTLPGSTGLGISVLMDGKVLMRKNYGMANVEFNVPFTPSTIVRMAYSEGREFMTIAAVLMEQKSLLSLRDGVRKYFPQLPDWSEPVTIEDLINHRSGFVDEWATLLLMHGDMRNRFDQAQFLNLLYTQPKPEVTPTKEYMYSNSDYGLLKLILEKASGKTLRAWMKENLFDPNGMTSTFLNDDKYEAIPLLSLSYQSWGTRVMRVMDDKDSPGGNYYIATSVHDLEKWAALHQDPNSPISKATARLLQISKQMPGQGKNYPFGLKIREENGLMSINHQGVNDATYLSRYPAQKLMIVILGNARTEYAPFHKQVASAILNLPVDVNPYRVFETKQVKYTKNELQSFTGRYFDIDTVTYESFVKDRKTLVTFVTKNDSLHVQLSESESFPLQYIQKNIFKDPDYDVYLEFLPQVKGPMKLVTYLNFRSRVSHHIKDESVLWKPAPDVLKKFTGKFYSKHLDYYLTLVQDSTGKLVVKRPTLADTFLEPETVDVFTMAMQKSAQSSFETFVRFFKDTSGNITHFTVTDPRLKGHRFDRVRDLQKME